MLTTTTATSPATDENRLTPPKEAADDSRVSTSAPQSRCNSWRARHHRANLRREKRLNLGSRSNSNSLSLPDCSDPTTSTSAPSDLDRRLTSKDTGHCDLCTVRSFKRTPKGIIESASFHKSQSSNSLLSTGSLAKTTDCRGASEDRHRADSVESCSDESDGTPVISLTPSYYRTLVLGAPGVGKSAIVQQFTRCDSQNDEDELKDQGPIVSVQLDSEESTMEFIDGAEWSDLECHRVDAYIIMYAVSEPESFTAAVSLLQYLRQDLGTDRTIFLVANKTDLVRQRLVSSRDAKQCALKNDSLYMETSVALNMNLDELLVGVLCKIKHQLIPIHGHGGARTSGNSLMPPTCAGAVLHKRPRSPSRALSAIGNFLRQACKRDGRGKGNLAPIAPMVG